MSLEHYITDDHGTVHAPDGRDWNQWVSASRTRNWCKRNPLQDWLNLHGEAAGFERDPEPDPRTDFREFIFAKGHAFEAEVLRHLSDRAVVFHVDGFDWPTQSLEACRMTFNAMVRREPIIAQGVLWNPENRTYGAADLLVRSDVLRSLFPDAITWEQSRVGAPGLGLHDCHYRVIDIKFTTLKLDRHWNASLEHLDYMVQVAIYNGALGRIQGYLPEMSYLLGRSWTGPKGASGSSCFDRLAPVRHDHCGSRGSLSDLVSGADAWVRRNRNDGGNWHPLAGPLVPELRPNPGAADYPWQGATKLVAEQTADPIQAWQVGIEGRDQAAETGITRWTDPRFCSTVAGLDGVRGDKLDTILRVNRDPGSPPVSPAYISAERETWAVPAAIEFFVDFETVSDINDDFSRLPERGGQALIFMIGCGHMEAGEWQFETFISNDLGLESEAEIVGRWLAHMGEVRRRVAPNVEEPLVFHWSPAESSGLTNGLKSARTRHPHRSAAWQEPNWFDFLGRVMRAEPVVVKGPMGFGLKTVVKSLKRHGLIETDWEDNVTDGLGAMVGACRCYEQSAATRASIDDIDLMQGIRRYNEVDCKVMMETIRYLRDRH